MPPCMPPGYASLGTPLPYTTPATYTLLVEYTLLAASARPAGALGSSLRLVGPRQPFCALRRAEVCSFLWDPRADHSRPRERKHERLDSARSSGAAAPSQEASLRQVLTRSHAPGFLVSLARAHAREGSLAQESSLRAPRRVGAFRHLNIRFIDAAAGQGQGPGPGPEL